MQAELVFLGHGPQPAAGARLAIPPQLPRGGVIPLHLRHSQRWHRTDVTRVILGSDPAWADVVLVDEPLTFHREHARFYLNHQQPTHSDFRAMQDCPVLVNGQLRPPLEWIRLQAGDALRLGAWEFRYTWRA